MIRHSTQRIRACCTRIRQATIRLLGNLWRASIRWAGWYLASAYDRVLYALFLFIWWVDPRPSVSELFGSDFAAANMRANQDADDLEATWNQGHGTIPEDDAINTLADNRLEWAAQLANAEYEQELGRMTSRVDRASALATTASVLIAVVTAVLPLSLTIPSNSDDLNVYVHLPFLWLRVEFFIYVALCLIVLIRSFRNALAVLETGEILAPSFVEYVSDLDGNHHLRRTVRILLYATAYNRTITRRRFNALDFAVRDQKVALTCLGLAGILWLSCWILRQLT
jgi:hypothetical protein